MRRNSSRKGVGVGQLQASKQGRSNPHLVNRLQEYAQTHNLEDLDGALEFLRRHYPEYKRKQTGPLRKYIATLVPLVQRRLWAPANLDDVPLGNNSRASPNSVKDQRLLEQEQEHVSRRRDDVAGDMNEDLTFEGFENSSDNSEGIDSDDTCKSDALEDDGGATNAGGRSFGKLFFSASLQFEELVFALLGLGFRVLWGPAGSGDSYYVSFRFCSPLCFWRQDLLAIEVFSKLFDGPALGLGSRV